MGQATTGSIPTPTERWTGWCGSFWRGVWCAWCLLSLATWSWCGCPEEGTPVWRVAGSRCSPSRSYWRRYAAAPGKWSRRSPSRIARDTSSYTISLTSLDIHPHHHHKHFPPLLPHFMHNFSLTLSFSSSFSSCTRAFIRF